MKCFYHRSDLDGLASGAIVKHIYPDCEMFPIDYGEPFPWNSIQKDEQVYMVDFCLQPFEDMIKLDRMCILTWIDHHKSAIISYNKSQQIATIRYVWQDIDKAGCELVWEYMFLNKEECEYGHPKWIKLLGRYDIWDKDNPLWESEILPFQYGMKAIIKTIGDFDIFFSKFECETTQETIELGRPVMRFIENDNWQYCENLAFETIFEGHKAIAVNRGLTNSQLLDGYYDESKHDLIIIFVFNKTNWTVSLYTTKDIDCSKIAKRHGGGGHKKAAGFQCSYLPFPTLINSNACSK